jgi:hypothetical protein
MYQTGDITVMEENGRDVEYVVQAVTPSAKDPDITYVKFQRKTKPFRPGWYHGWRSGEAGVGHPEILWFTYATDNDNTMADGLWRKTKVEVERPTDG